MVSLHPILMFFTIHGCSKNVNPLETGASLHDCTYKSLCCDGYFKPAGFKYVCVAKSACISFRKENFLLCVNVMVTTRRQSSDLTHVNVWLHMYIVPFRRIESAFYICENIFLFISFLCLILFFSVSLLYSQAPLPVMEKSITYGWSGPYTEGCGWQERFFTWQKINVFCLLASFPFTHPQPNSSILFPSILLLYALVQLHYSRFFSMPPSGYLT